MDQVAHEVPETAESIPNLVAAIGRALVDYPDHVSVVVTPGTRTFSPASAGRPERCGETRWQAG